MTGTPKYPKQLIQWEKDYAVKFGVGGGGDNQEQIVPNSTNQFLFNKALKFRNINSCFVYAV